MAQQHFLANCEIEMVLFALKAFQVLFSGFTIVSRLALRLARDYLWPALHRANRRLVDTLSFPTGTGASCSLSNHVRENAFLLAAAQWNGPKYCAYPASFGDRRHVNRSSHEVRTAISPRSKLPIGRLIFQNCPPLSSRIRLDANTIIDRGFIMPE